MSTPIDATVRLLTRVDADALVARAMGSGLNADLRPIGGFPTRPWEVKVHGTSEAATLDDLTAGLDVEVLGDPGH